MGVPSEHPTGICTMWLTPKYTIWEIFLKIVDKVFEFYSSFYEDAPFGPNLRNLLLGKTKNAFLSFVIPNMFPKFQDERLRTFEISDLQKKKQGKNDFKAWCNTSSNNFHLRRLLYQFINAISLGLLPFIEFARCSSSMHLILKYQTLYFDSFCNFCV